MTNTIGKIFSITSFGSSHGKALGAVVDGCPANLELSEEDIQIELNKRRPGTSALTTSRKEGDKIEILSGIFEGKTDGTPITGIVYNTNQKSKDYSNIKNTPRPGHGDFCWLEKYGIYDYNGGGRGSGRTTISHVIGGAIAKKLLKSKGIKITSHVIQIGEIKANNIDYENLEEKLAEFRAYWKETKGIKPKVTMWAVRAAVTGRTCGADMCGILVILGKETSLYRAQKAIKQAV